ncbi:hypothetical protein IU433_18190 [Nocardia puris]|uniref:RNA ligase family protein n=1 Tax=Nocardia puris TaxID=208602 RepID=UPI001893825E|nr:RNA ligase family protein [Nocardia puris]MBF6212374.1 hypothetical protein [Nocardia puris]MBF6366621.1 hypothetical protein [Nocardia puris]MBF6460963.1 hypothetical protein [Nocardia puris]
MLRDFADAAAPADDLVRVYYLELYGGKVTAASKQYTGTRAIGYRLFDVVELADYASMLRRLLSDIFAWHDAGGQPFLDETRLAAAAEQAGLELTPRLFTVDAADLPRDVAATHELLADRLPVTRCGLDQSAGGHPEGIVLRTEDRSVIAKARFEDYARTLRRRERATAR